MGKGGGCVPIKKKRQPPLSAANDGDAAPSPIEFDRTTGDGELATATTTTVGTNPAIAAGIPLRIFIVFYSMYGHVESLARRMKKGVDGVDGVEATVYRVPETLPTEVLEQMKAPPKDLEIPEITSAELAAADGFLFGFPTRYGCMAAQMKAFFDSTGQLWREQTLAGNLPGSS